MSNERTGLYEGMFLFPQSATAKLQEAIDHLKEILAKCETTIITFSKWDDRRLAYEVDGNKRGIYFLVYFNAPSSKMSELERRCNQSEEIIRMMVTRAEHLPQEIIDSNEGSNALADEIKVRGKQNTETGTSSSSKVTRKEDEAKSKPKAPKKETTEEAPQEVQEDAPVATETAETEEVTEA
ncbi:MAG TPA: 30S ribosomal protein S6 [Phycisphaerales bacterium]|nr:30S ribosomal protein S6 [Phycisphaerales bacterium]